MNSSSPSRAAAALLAGAVMLLAGSCTATGPADPLPPLQVQRGAATVTASPVAGTPASSAALPQLSIAKIAATSSLVPLGLNPDRTVEVPPVSQPEQAGLYAEGPIPGDPGPAVVLGHVNGNGRAGVFARLSQLVIGDQIDITRPDGHVASFRVYRTQTVNKPSFPTAAVYSDTPGPELRLITCGGDLDRQAHSYLANVIVYAALTALR